MELVAEVRLQENFFKQYFHEDAMELFQTSTIPGKNTSKKLLEKCKSTAGAIEELKKPNALVKDLDLTNKIGANSVYFFKSLPKK